MSENDYITTNMVLANTEFFAYENEVWLRDADGSIRQLLETDYDIVREMAEQIEVFYPKAYTALSEEYNGCLRNQSYFRFRVVCRFVRCNFAALDNVPDINASRQYTFEHINCPLRGECKYDRVICRPEFDHKLSSAEMRVMALVFEGLTEEQIGDRLCLSPMTVHTHVRNAYVRLGIHSKAEFIKYASKYSLFL